ncbi:MAG: xanthine dehydrogenase small subunit, partial [Alphaproteobacteria bacterium]|nr:xanthine dehydrogenase small subunit [Alphaproteobacteria bacterium]
SVCAGFMVYVRDGRIEEARLAFGGMAATPKRAEAAEAALRGQEWDEAAIEAAGRALEQDFAPISDWRASAEYRALIARNLLTRFHLDNAPAVSP